MSFSSRLRTKKNIALPGIENTSVYNAQRCYNAHRRCPPGSIPNTLHLANSRRSQENTAVPSNDVELENQYSSLNSADVSSTNVECVLPGKFEKETSYVVISCKNYLRLLRFLHGKS